jgi:hypothetical protein
MVGSAGAAKANAENITAERARKWAVEAMLPV